MLLSQCHKKFVKLINLQAIHLKEMKKSNFQKLALKELVSKELALNAQLKELKINN